MPLQLDAAITALERAIEFDPYAEEIYRRLLRLHAERNRPDALARTWRMLEGRLAELDVEPDDSTLRLYRELSGKASPQLSNARKLESTSGQRPAATRRG